METEVLSLAKHLKKIVSRQKDFEDNLDKITDTVNEIETSLSDFVYRMDKYEEAQVKFDSSAELLYQRQDETKVAVGGLQEKQRALFSQTREIETEINRINIDAKETKQTTADLSVRIAKIEQYKSDNRPNKVFFYPPDRIKYFVGRNTELQQLQEGFISAKYSSKTQVVSGLGGSGKTTLAIEYAWLMQVYYGGGVFWFSAENKSSLENSVAGLAFDAETVGANVKETLMLTLKWLSKMTPNWLLVIDNVDEDELSNEIKDLLMGTWKRNSSGHVLITTRREPKEVEETFKIELVNCIELGPMTKYESLTFMLKRTGMTDLNDENLENLVEELDGLPLAMEQAAAHIKTLNCSFQEYLDRFKKKRLKLLNRRASTTFPVEKERLTVRTTWQLNFDYISRQSEEEGLGNAAPLVMNITAFFYADDIPRELINIGDPAIMYDSLKDTFEDSLGVKQVIDILTRFSLFHTYRENTLQVHRLVQEVIRDNVEDKFDKMYIIQGAIRMLHAALKNSLAPEDILAQADEETKSKLHLWSRLGTTASKLRNHINNFVLANGFEEELCWTFETCKVFQASAVFESIYQRQTEALAAQEQMLQMMLFSNLSENQQTSLTVVTIPLHENERIILQEHITSTITLENGRNSDIVDPETLRTYGNKAFQNKDNHCAIRLYTEAIRSCKAEAVDCRLFCNRSLSFLKIQDYEKALKDADHCIELDPSNWKGHCWRAYAVAHLIENGKLPKRMEATGLASASIAAHLNPRCNLEFKMKMHYPVVVYKLIKDSKTLQREYATIMQRHFTTLLLQKGQYNIGRLVVPRSIQIVGIEEGVEIFIDGELQIMRPSPEMIDVDFEPENELYVHFERVHFISGGGTIVVCSGTVISFYGCKFSNGRAACEEFPHCKGGDGCNNANSDECRLEAEKFKLTSSTGFGRTGVPGTPGLSCQGGNVTLNRCIIDRCGGCGLVCIGHGSLLQLARCIIKNNRQVGLDVRYFGQLIVIDSLVESSQFHGVLIGPYGKAKLDSNRIQKNGHEGIYCYEDVREDQPIPADLEVSSCNTTYASRTTVEIENNIISHNGLNGATLDGGTFIVNRNKFFDNWLWGMILSKRSSCCLTNNDIFSNKCGGVKIGHNHSGVIYIDGNTIRDHTGPHIHSNIELNEERDKCPIEVLQSASKLTGSPEDELIVYTRRPVITNRNVQRNNNLAIRCPSAEIFVSNACSFCRRIGRNMKRCSKCKKAPYCSKSCQSNHWRRHKHFCNLFCRKYTVLIKMSDIIRHPEHLSDNSIFIKIRTFAPSLKGIGEGPSPDPESTQTFMVKIQSGPEYSLNDPDMELMLYDRSTELDISFRNPQLYHLIMECGVLGAHKLSTKKIYCWASFDKHGKCLKVYTDNLLPLQTW